MVAISTRLGAEAASSVISLLTTLAESANKGTTMADKKPKGSKWRKKPKGWTTKSREKFWKSLVGDAEHPVTVCIEKMTGKVDDPGAFCAALADRVKGTTKWRGPKKKSPQKSPKKMNPKKAAETEFLIIDSPKRLVDVTMSIISRLTSGAGWRSGVVWIVDPDNYIGNVGKVTMVNEVTYGLRAYADEHFDNTAAGSVERAKYSALYDLINQQLKVSVEERVSKTTGRKGWSIQIKPPMQVLDRKATRMGKGRHSRPQYFDPDVFLRRRAFDDED